MKKNILPAPERTNIPVKNSHTGLTSEEARLREAGGWRNGLTLNANRSEKEII